METERSHLPCRACRVGGWPSAEHYIPLFIWMVKYAYQYWLPSKFSWIPDLQSTYQSSLLKHPLYIDTRVTWRPILCCNIHSLDHQLLIELCWECSTAITSFRGATISCATVQLADAPCKTALIQRWPMTVYTVCVRFTGQQLQHHWGFFLTFLIGLCKMYIRTRLRHNSGHLA